MSDGRWWRTPYLALHHSVLPKVLAGADQEEAIQSVGGDEDYQAAIRRDLPAALDWARRSQTLGGRP